MTFRMERSDSFVRSHAWRVQVWNVSFGGLKYPNLSPGKA